ncbi:unnamed protein product [Bursaphelenchus xylophilus]|uniref:(pine wood nematode) hypothetical protein n=1 Tax=Bursaphelenchus xylophilus TaxID=6326 RepID=A0A1I7SMH8_BURXY|nr:unnamed protein product [Bursaphelenchus xylophilus]CAG9130216.1 unnamed protein product [Bursaphelenchus xylophilus]
MDQRQELEKSLRETVENGNLMVNSFYDYRADVDRIKEVANIKVFTTLRQELQKLLAQGAETQPSLPKMKSNSADIQTMQQQLTEVEKNLQETNRLTEEDNESLLLGKNELNDMKDVILKQLI